MTVYEAVCECCERMKGIRIQATDRELVTALWYIEDRLNAIRATFDEAEQKATNEPETEVS